MGTQKLDEDAGVCEDAEYAAAGDSEPTLTRTRLGADAELAEADFSDVVAASRVARTRTLACGVVCEDVRGAAASDCDARPTRTRLWEGVGPADADIGVDVGVLTRIRLGVVVFWTCAAFLARAFFGVTPTDARYAARCKSSASRRISVP